MTELWFQNVDRIRDRLAKGELVIAPVAIRQMDGDGVGPAEGSILGGQPPQLIDIVRQGEDGWDADWRPLWTLEECANALQRGDLVHSPDGAVPVSGGPTPSMASGILAVGNAPFLLLEDWHSLGGPGAYGAVAIALMSPTVAAEIKARK